MALERETALFGSRNRTAVLKAIRMLEETYPSELAKLLGVRLFTVQSILQSLEREGIVASRTVGRTRTVSLDPRYFAREELGALLWKLGHQDVGLQNRLAGRRRRPRRVAKAGLS
jgi:DNA-binding transcriptional ArsR family regulator